MLAQGAQNLIFTSSLPAPRKRRTSARCLRVTVHKVREIEYIFVFTLPFDSIAEGRERLAGSHSSLSQREIVKKQFDRNEVRVGTRGRGIFVRGVLFNLPACGNRAHRRRFERARSLREGSDVDLFPSFPSRLLASLALDFKYPPSSHALTSRVSNVEIFLSRVEIFLARIRALTTSRKSVDDCPGRSFSFEHTCG